LLACVTPLNRVSCNEHALYLEEPTDPIERFRWDLRSVRLDDIAELAPDMRPARQSRPWVAAVV